MTDARDGCLARAPIAYGNGIMEGRVGMTTGEQLGRLAVVPAREVWPHEAHDFTPWLLQNVDVLSDLLGMDLVLDVAEHPVGGFSLDLLGRDETTGRVVIVENQLEPSDHAHLGQILTYAAGTDPTTIVWVTTGFRPEHRAALDWLNERTDEDTRFFGVEIEVVRIGASLPAPAFKLVAQPNDWEKQVKAASVGTGELTERGRLYWEFWDTCRARIQSEHPSWSRARTSTRDSWYTMSLGLTGVTLAMTFTRDHGLGLQLVFESQDSELNSARFEALLARKTVFEAAFRRSVEWEDLPGRKSCRVSAYSSFKDVADVDQWSAMIEWLVDQQLRFRGAIEAVGGLPVE